MKSKNEENKEEGSRGRAQQRPRVQDRRGWLCLELEEKIVWTQIKQGRNVCTVCLRFSRTLHKCIRKMM